MTRQPLEKHVQADIVRLLRSVGAAVYTIGRPPRRDSVHKGTGQTPGLPDCLAFVPDLESRGGIVALALEIKRPGGDPLKKMRPEQRAFREQCIAAGVYHVCGGVDEVLAFLQVRGLVKETAAYRRVAAPTEG